MELQEISNDVAVNHEVETQSGKSEKSNKNEKSEKKDQDKKLA